MWTLRSIRSISFYNYLPSLARSSGTIRASCAGGSIAHVSSYQQNLADVAAKIVVRLCGVIGALRHCRMDEGKRKAP